MRKQPERCLSFDFYDLVIKTQNEKEHGMEAASRGSKEWPTLSNVREYHTVPYCTVLCNVMSCHVSDLDEERTGVICGCIRSNLKA